MRCIDVQGAVADAATTGPRMRRRVRDAWMRQATRVRADHDGPVRIEVWIGAPRDGPSRPDLRDVLVDVMSALDGVAWVDGGQVVEATVRREDAHDGRTGVTVRYYRDDTRHWEERRWTSG